MIYQYLISIVIFQLTFFKLVLSSYMRNHRGFLHELDLPNYFNY